MAKRLLSMGVVAKSRKLFSFIHAYPVQVPTLNQCRPYYLYSPEPIHPIYGKEVKWCSGEEAVSVLRSNTKVFLHGAAATPLYLVDAMAKYGKDSALTNVEIIHLHTDGPGVYMEPEYEGIFRCNNLFIGSNAREAVKSGRADFTPIFLSEVPLLFRRKTVRLDVALISCSPPDKHGFCTLGPSVDCARAAIQNASYIIGQVNSKMPRTFGDAMIHMTHFDALVEHDHDLPVMLPPEPSVVETKIGNIIASNLVHDGATLQMGIGSIPDSVLKALWSHKDLGIHSEMFSDGVIDLVESGALTNARKVIHPGKITGGFAMGSQRLYDFMDDNPFIVMCDIAFVNQVAIISQNPRVTAINSCIEVDLTGQVVSDSIGTMMYSGVGGQVDFLRGAALGVDGLGKPILALPSTTKKGESKIVPFIKEGAGVVTTRAHVHWVVTEFGIAHLFGKNLRQRAYELINIAHPDHRDSLERAAFERLKCMPSP